MSTPILHERGPFYVTREPLNGRSVYYVYRIVGAHPERLGTFDLRDEKEAMRRAVEFCDRKSNEYASR